MKSTEDTPPKKKVASFSPLRVFLLFFQILGWVVVIAVPLLGAWVASSLAAFANGPIWLAPIAGALLFPILPLAWELWAHVRRRKQENPKPRRVRLRNRLVLRTLFSSSLALAAVVAILPKTTFTALSTRGDWMLEGRTEEWTDVARKILFGAADQLEWTYLAVQDNPFERYADEQPDDKIEPQPQPQPKPQPQPQPVPAPVKTSTRAIVAAVTSTRAVAAVKTASKTAIAQVKTSTKTGVVEIVLHEKPDSATKPNTPAATAAVSAPDWPLEAKLHPLIVTMPKSIESSHEAVARYIAANERDRIQRIKAIHDYVADRIAYDAEAYADGRYPPQDAETVFTARRAVCAGYARLFREMMTVAGEEAISVVGDARTQDQGVGGGGHAWNAVRIEDRWYLVDVTWDAGYVNGRTFTKRYSTAYFLTPPEIFGLTHFPDKPKWQLVASPLSRGDFMRQPMLSPDFYAHRLSLISPARSQITAERGAIELVLANPSDVSLIATYSPAGEESMKGDRCEISHGRDDARVKCTLPSAGTYRVAIFVSDDALASHKYVGHLEVQNPG